MITRAHIDPCLQVLDTAYNAATDPYDAERFAKLAIIELCGWIEESIDAMVMRCGKRNLKDRNNYAYCEKQIIERTWGFEYDKHFRMMLIRLVGLIQLEKLEQIFDPVKFAKMKGTLRTLKSVRDSVAHTHLKGTARTLSAPSVMIRNFQDVYDGLMDMDRKLRSSGF